jgi:steroid 5-alpha reductase family enzyme
MYVISFSIATVSIYYLIDVVENLILLILIGDIIATILIYIFGLILNNASIYDPYWSVAPIWIIIMYYLFGSFIFHPDHLIIIIPLGLWSIRLTYNWIKSFRDLSWQDFRYSDIKAKFPRIYPLVCFIGIMLIPTLLVFAGMIGFNSFLSSTPVYSNVVQATQLASYVQPKTTLYIFLIAGASLVLFGTIYQWISDYQKSKFLKDDNNCGKCIDTGLWNYSRHPNYFGEISIWWGIFLVSLVNFTWMSLVGPTAITLLFLFISIPMMERHLEKSRPEAFSEYKKEVRSSLFPWFRKKTKESSK